MDFQKLFLNQNLETEFVCSWVVSNIAISNYSDLFCLVLYPSINGSDFREDEVHKLKFIPIPLPTIMHETK